MGIFLCTLGCKGAGGVFKAVAAVGIIGARVAAPVVNGIPRGTPADPDATYPVASYPVDRAYPVPEGCEELPPTPEGMRAMSCRGRVLVQDARSGLWRE